jgi:hypothetical protein
MENNTTSVAPELFKQPVRLTDDAQSAAIIAPPPSVLLPAMFRRLLIPVLLALCVILYSRVLAWQDLVATDDLLLVTVFAAAAISSIAGFAFSAVCGAVLFHLNVSQISAVQTMMICSVGIQTYMVVALWRSIDWRGLAPFLIGGIAGLPVGLAILLHTNRAAFTHWMGALLCAYSVYMLLRRPLVLPQRFRLLDGLIGFAGGITGGAAAFPGAPVTIWCQMLGWQRDHQRGLYQPYILILQVLALSCMFSMGAATPRSPALLTAGLAIPPALAGTMIGLRLYRRFSDRQFFRAVSLLLLVSGVILLA